MYYPSIVWGLIPDKNVTVIVELVTGTITTLSTQRTELTLRILNRVSARAMGGPVPGRKCFPGIQSWPGRVGLRFLGLKLTGLGQPGAVGPNGHSDIEPFWLTL